jgi:two-component system response regulator AtoC
MEAMSDSRKNLIEPNGPANAFGTLTGLVRRGKSEEPVRGCLLLVLEATGLTVHPVPPSGSMTVGRSEECDVQLRDPLASARHAILYAEPLAIEDRGSANGTVVGSRALEPKTRTAIRPGEAIAIGGSLLMVYQVEPDDEEGRSRTRTDAVGDAIVVEDPAMRTLHELVERVASGPINVVFLGETGVGKDVMAELLHRKSPRRDAPLVRINCAALSESLLENELFGHERGAHFGATSARPGLLEVADGGTVFLDDVGDLTPALQTKLLRVIEAREVTRLGALRPRAVDVRFVAATQRDLEEEVDRGAFRADLFFRLSGSAIWIPPLRERASEILPLAEAFIARLADQMRLPSLPRLLPAAEDLLIAHKWAGNIRELRNVIERAVLLSPDGTIGPADLGLSQRASSPPPSATASSNPFDDERERIIQALVTCSGNQTRAAKLLQMPRRTLVAKLPRYNIPRPRKFDGK